MPLIELCCLHATCRGMMAHSRNSTALSITPQPSSMIHREAFQMLSFFFYTAALNIKLSNVIDTQYRTCLLKDVKKKTYIAQKALKIPQAKQKKKLHSELKSELY